MYLESKITEMLKLSMKAKDQHTTDTLRMLKTKLTEKKTSPGFSGVMTDDGVLDVIFSYKKSLQKAIVEFAVAGDKAKEQIDDLNFEISICDQFLPVQIDEDTLRELVAKRIKTLGVADVKQSGKVVGSIMKEYKNQLDGIVVKKIVESMLQ